MPRQSLACELAQFYATGIHKHISSFDRSLRICKSYAAGDADWLKRAQVRGPWASHDGMSPSELEMSTPSSNGAPASRGLQDEEEGAACLINGISWHKSQTALHPACRDMHQLRVHVTILKGATCMHAVCI